MATSDLTQLWLNDSIRLLPLFSFDWVWFVEDLFIVFFFCFFFRFPFMFLRWRTLQMSQISSASFTFSPATGPSRKNGCVPKIKAANILKKKKIIIIKKNSNNNKQKKQQVIWSALALSLVFFDISLFFYQLFYLYLPVCLRHLAVMIGTVLSVFLSLFLKSVNVLMCFI